MADTAQGTAALSGLGQKTLRERICKMQRGKQVSTMFLAGIMVSLRANNLMTASVRLANCYE